MPERTIFKDWSGISLPVVIIVSARQLFAEFAAGAGHGHTKSDLQAKEDGGSVKSAGPPNTREHRSSQQEHTYELEVEHWGP